jgi:hypothetical protein
MIVNCDKNTHCILDQMTWCLSCHNWMERPRALHPNTSLWPCRPPCVLHQEPMNGTKCSAANDTEDCVTATWFQLRTGQGLDRDWTDCQGRCWRRNLEEQLAEILLHLGGAVWVQSHRGQRRIWGNAVGKDTPDRVVAALLGLQREVKSLQMFTGSQERSKCSRTLGSSFI